MSDAVDLPVGGAAGATPTADRRVVTILFADISGFTRVAEELDPEDLSALVKEAFGELMEEVRARGGWLEKHVGDAVLAIFGAPVVREDDPERAVSTALAMQARMAALNERLERRLDLHIGVNTGLVVMDSHHGAADFMVIGDTVNTCARLQQEAGPGQVFVGAATRAATESLFEYRQLAPRTVKGKQEKVAIYECLGPSASLGTVSPAGVASPLVGRDAEATALRSRIERLAEGEGAVVVLLGEAGLGKSRLLAEASRIADAAGVRWLEGRALPFSRTISYSPFREIVARDAGIHDEDSELERWTKLERRVRGLLDGEADEVLPYLAALLALEIRGTLLERVRFLDGEAMGRQIFRATWRFFERVSEESPVALVFEDWHWADESSSNLLQHLLPLVANRALLVCCASRPDEDAPTGRVRAVAAERYTELELAPLRPENGVALLGNLLGPEALPRRLRDRILERAGGNPLFVEEIVRSLIDGGDLLRDEPGQPWRLAAAPEEIAFPDTLRAVIMARIDRLDAEAKELLRVGAVIGRSFPHRVLAAVAGADSGVDRRLAELEELDLVLEHSRAPELEYIFKHALIQEAIYESILIRRRRELHREVGAAIERLFADRLEEFYGLLAYHYARAEEWEQAQHYLFAAGDQAGRIAADSEALEHYRQATAAYARAFGDRWEPLQRAELDRKIGEALFRRGEHELAFEYLLGALVALGHPLPGSRWRIRAAIVRALLGQLGRRFVPRRRHTAEESDPAAAELARVYVALCWADYFFNQERALLEVLRLTKLSERAGLAVTTVTGYFGIGMICCLVPAYRTAERSFRRALAVAATVDHPIALGEGHLGLMYYEQVRGRWDDSFANRRVASDLFWHAGDLRRWGASWVDAWVFRSREELEHALEQSAELARVGSEGGDHQIWGWGLLGLGSALWRVGAVEEAIPKLEQAIELLRDIPDHLAAACASGHLAQCHLRRGRVAEALAVLDEARAHATRHGLRGALASQAYVAHAQASVRALEQAAPDEREAALRRARTACKDLRSQARLDRAAVAPAYLWRGTYEWLRGRRGRAERLWERSIRVAEAGGAAFNLAEALFEAGTRTDDPARLERAAQLFRDLDTNVPEHRHSDPDQSLPE